MVSILVQILFQLLTAVIITTAVLALDIALPGCPSACGNISVPYPFGIGPGCHRDGFNLTCDRSHRPPKLFLGDGTVELLEISLPNSTVRIRSIVNFTVALNGTGKGTWGGLGGANTPYHLTERRNRLVIIGSCNMQAVLLDGTNTNNTIAACTSICALANGRSDFPAQVFEGMGSCSGVGCCQTSIYIGRASYNILLSSSAKDLPSFFFPQFGLVHIIDDEWLDGNTSKLVPLSDRPADRPVVPAVLDWAIGSSACPGEGSDTACVSSHSVCRNSTSMSHSGYSCQCSAGYEGNPYITNGCQDVDECARPDIYSCYGECINKAGSFLCLCPRGTTGDARSKDGCVPTSSGRPSAGLLVGLAAGSGIGLLSLVFGAVFVTHKLKAQGEKKLRAKFFKQNRGLLLQQLVDKDIAERMVFSLEELEKATNKFDEARKLGGGGHGTVYKGILSNQHVVAIKKSKITVQREIDDFINEVAILSQINHRNVVRLFGCCLETQVPLLVYEFIPNGTLSDHLHVEGPRSHDRSLSWEDRLRIALETASALAYLHSSALTSIIHRDIKSANILLDDHFTAKVSDFGASRGMPIDQAAVTTAVQGTFGYLDPEYYQTRRLTNKSDVYSFGVILVELLTRKKPSAFMASEGISLIAQFNLLMNQDKLLEILDPQVILEGLEDAKVVAALAVTCLSLKGEERPVMRQVAMKLEVLLGSKENTGQRHTDGLNSTSTQMSNANDNSRQYSMEQEVLLSASFPR